MFSINLYYLVILNCKLTNWVYWSVLDFILRIYQWNTLKFLLEGHGDGKIGHWSGDDRQPHYIGNISH